MPRRVRFTYISRILPLFVGMLVTPVPIVLLLYRLGFLKGMNGDVFFAEVDGIALLFSRGPLVVVVMLFVVIALGWAIRFDHQRRT